jgi:hypothetical protein
MAAVSPQRAATEHGLDTRIPGGGEKKKRTNNPLSFFKGESLAL